MGSLRRRVEIATRGTSETGEARAVVEDDYHHFRVGILYQNKIVVDASWQGLRTPWSTCPTAGFRLLELKGMRMSPVANDVTRETNQFHQCTHMMDLAGLAIAAAAKKIGHRIYEIEVLDDIEDISRARLWRDDALVLEWYLKYPQIVEPARYAGIKTGLGFSKWVEDSLPPEEAEAAWVLRRGVFISRGRGIDLDAIPNAAVTANGGCYIQQPAQAAQALRNIGSTLDFTEHPEILCRDDRSWLAFEQD